MKFSCPFTAANDAALEAVVSGVGSIFNTAIKMKLMKNNPPIAAGTLLADIIEADYLGYAEVSSPDTPMHDVDVELGKTVIRSLPADIGWYFEVSNGVTPQIIYGAYAVNAAEDKLLGAAKFAIPITISEGNQFIDLAKIEWDCSQPVFA